MVARTAVQHFGVQVGARARGEAVEEVVDQFALQVAHHPHLDLQIDDRVRPPAEIDRNDGERFVHRHDEVAGAIDALAIAERLEERFTEHDADVFDGVVLIHVEIARRLQRQIESAVACKQLEHVIEETDAGADVVAAAAVDRQRACNLRLGRLTIEPRCSTHRCLPAATDSSASMAAAVWSSMPAVIRIQPGVVGSFDRSRTWTPRAASAWTTSGTASPTCTRTKLAALSQNVRPSVRHASYSRFRDSVTCAA